MIRYEQYCAFTLLIIVSIPPNPEKGSKTLSSTKEALEHFDNQHDFERMAADLLNALGYQGVEPMAPSGGPDGWS